jgi:hypothetical protein
MAAESSPIQFTGRVTRITMLSEHSGSVIVAERAPEFAFTVKVLSARPANPPFAPSATVVLAVRNPAKLFGGVIPGPVGNTYDFTITPTTSDGRTSYSNLTASKLK